MTHDDKPDVRPTTGDSQWFTQARFGLYIHWGLYSMPARHEWVKARERMTNAEYDRYFRHFEPDLYDPNLWADAAATAGMKYFVVTAKHHEGFCLWDSKHTDFKAPAAPNCRRDLLRPMVDAFRSRGLRAGLYYSLLDWHHSHYWIDNRNHPQRAAFVPDGDFDEVTLTPFEHSGGRPQVAPADAQNAGRDQAKYAQYMRDQVRELLTEYGPIDLLWFDFSFPAQNGISRLDFSRGKGREAWQSEELLKMIRQLTPNILLNNRLDLEAEPASWDFATPEQVQPRAWQEVGGRRVVWEACQTFSGSWGYHRDEADWRSSDELIRALIDCVAKGGNLLLNVGPTGRGEFDRRALDRLQGIGRWMRHHSRSIYGCTEAPSEFTCPKDCRLTFDPVGKRLYVHLLTYPYKHLHLDGRPFVDRVEYAQFLNDGSEATLGLGRWHAGQLGQGDDTLVVNLPQSKPDVAVTVIELFLK